MRRIVRPDTPPKELSHPLFAQMRQTYLAFLRLPKERRDQTRPPDRTLPNVPGLLAAVAAPFDGLCAFCGIETAEEIHRFRPPQNARVLPYPGEPIVTMPSPADEAYPRRYGWLADAWQNLYPICGGCQPANPAVFLVIGDLSPVPDSIAYESYLTENTGRWPFAIKEQTLLLDPCSSDLSNEMTLLDDGRLEGLSESGRFTIRFFYLNRPSLVEARAKRQTTSALRPRKPRADKPLAQQHRWELARIQIENFKAIERLELDMPPAPATPANTRPRAPALLILGENAAGKSTILEAVALAMMPEPARRRLAKEPQKLLLNPSFMGDATLPMRSQGRVTLDFVAQGAKETVSLHLTPTGLRVERSAKDLPQVFGYGAYRHYVDGLRGRSADRGVVSLFKSDSLLSNPRDWLVALSDTRFNEVVSALRFVFGVQFEAIHRSGADCVVVTMTEDVRQETPLLAVSSGFRTVLALVCDVLRWLMDAPATRDLPLEKMPALILIDEVEAHLHPRWKISIVDGLRQALPAATFLVTTHDPLCLRLATPGEVRVMVRQLATSATDLPVMLEALENLPDMAALTIDQLLTADFFGLGDTDDPKSVRALENLMEQYSSSSPDTHSSEIVKRLQEQLQQDLPIGRTEIERIVQEAVQAYQTERRSDKPVWRETTKTRILDLLRGL